MNKIQAGRCLTLAWFLRTEVPEECFDQGVWGNTRDASLEKKKVSLTPTCGTSACALGWATTVWPKRFRMNFQYSEDDHLSGVVEYFNGKSWEKCGLTDAQRKPLAEWFGLSLAELYEVFGPWPCSTKQKAAQIEEFVQRHGYEYAT